MKLVQSARDEQDRARSIRWLYRLNQISWSFTLPPPAQKHSLSRLISGPSGTSFSRMEIITTLFDIRKGRTISTAQLMQCGSNFTLLPTYSVYACSSFFDFTYLGLLWKTFFDAVRRSAKPDSPLTNRNSLRDVTRKPKSFLVCTRKQSLYLYTLPPSTTKQYVYICTYVCMLHMGYMFMVGTAHIGCSLFHFQVHQ